MILTPEQIAVKWIPPGPGAGDEDFAQYKQIRNEWDTLQVYAGVVEELAETDPISDYECCYCGATILQEHGSGCLYLRARELRGKV